MSIRVIIDAAASVIASDGEDRRPYTHSNASHSMQSHHIPAEGVSDTLEYCTRAAETRRKRERPSTYCHVSTCLMPYESSPYLMSPNGTIILGSEFLKTRANSSLNIESLKRLHSASKTRQELGKNSASSSVSTVSASDADARAAHRA